MQLYSLIVTGIADRLDAAVNLLLELGYDVRVRQPTAVVAYGECPYTASAVERLGWRVEERAAILDNVPLDLAA
jgi:hypothetical protein